MAVDECSCGRCHVCGANDHQASTHPVPSEVFATQCELLLARFEAAADALTKALAELAPLVARLSKDLDRAVEAGRDARGE